MQITQYKNVYTEKLHMQYKLHAGMGPYILNKYVNWLALNWWFAFDVIAAMLEVQHKRICY